MQSVTDTACECSPFVVKSLFFFFFQMLLEETLTFFVCICCKGESASGLGRPLLVSEYSANVKITSNSVRILVSEPD